VMILTRLTMSKLPCCLLSVIVVWFLSCSSSCFVEDVSESESESEAIDTHVSCLVSQLVVLCCDGNNAM